MCTLIVLDRVVPGQPLVVGSNRDEYLARPAAAPARVAAEGGRPAFVAPQDLEAGGTWMGVNARGLFVGLTNRHTAELQAKRRSRGLLVRDALGCPDARSVAEEMRENLAGTYNPFHLLYGDGRSTFLTCLRGEGAETRELAPGLHVLGSRDPDDLSSSKLRRIREAVQRLALGGTPRSLFEGLAALLRNHEGGANPLEHVCIHTQSYGTRSSTLLSLGEERWRYWHAEGPPCESKYLNMTGLLDELRQAA